MNFDHIPEHIRLTGRKRKHTQDTYVPKRNKSGEELADLFFSGASYPEIAAEYKVSEKEVREIIRDWMVLNDRERNRNI